MPITRSSTSTPGPPTSSGRRDFYVPPRPARRRSAAVRVERLLAVSGRPAGRCTWCSVRTASEHHGTVRQPGSRRVSGHGSRRHAAGADRRGHRVPRGDRAARQHGAAFRPGSRRHHDRAELRAMTAAADDMTRPRTSKIKVVAVRARPSRRPRPRSDGRAGRPPAARAHSRAASTFRQVRSPQAVPELHRARRRSPGAATSSRNTSSACRSSTRIRRSIRAPIRSSACRRDGCAPGWCATTARKGGADAIVIELPKGGYAPVFKQRDTPVAGRAVDGGRRSPAEHHRGAAVRRSQRRAAISATSATALREEIIHRLAKLDVAAGARVRRRAARRPATRPSAGGDDASAAACGKSGERLRADRAARRQRHRLATSGRSRSTRRSATRSPRRSASPTRSSRSSSRELGDARPAPRRAAADREPRRAQSLPAGPLSPESAHRRRAAQGARLLREGDRRGRAVRARAQRARRRAYGLLAPLRRVRPPSQVWTQGRVERGGGGDARRQLGRGAHLARARQVDAGLGLARRRARVPAGDLRSTRATPPRITGTRCRASSPLGRLDEALDEMRVAQSLDPVSSIVARDLAVIHFYRRDFETALEQCDHTIELNPHFSPAYWTLGVIQEQRKDFDESIGGVPARRRSVAAQRRACTARSGRAVRARRPEERRRSTSLRKLEAIREAALRLADRVRRRSASRSTSASSASRWLDKACEDRAFDVLALSVDPRFDSERHGPRLEAILQRAGLV